MSSEGRDSSWRPVMDIVVIVGPGPALGVPWQPWGTRKSPWGLNEWQHIARAPEGTPIPTGWRLLEREFADVGGTALPWVWTAPLTMSRTDAEAAGSSVPNPEDYVVVLREDGGRWHVGLGVGHSGGQRNLKGSWATREEAGSAGVNEARKRYREEVDVICLTRGGLLTWGVPFDLVLGEVVIVTPDKGQTAWNAYETGSGKGFAVVQGGRS